MPPSTDKSNQRHVRHSVYQSAQYRCIDAEEASRGPHEATVLDFSFSGLRIACAEPLEHGARVGIRLVLQGGTEDEIGAITRWSRPLDDGGYHHGMQFIEAGAVLPLLGLNKDDYATKFESGPESPGVLQVVDTARISRIERLRCVVRGDLEIDQGLSQSQLIVEGQLKVTGGEVVGGETSAAMRMELSAAGDSFKTPTRLLLAYLSDEIADVRKRAQLHLDRDVAEVASCKERIEAFNGDDGVPSHEDREQVTALMFEMQGKEASVEQLKEKIGLLDGLIARKTCAELSIRGTVHPGVRVGLYCGTGYYETTQPIAGPLFIRADESGVLHYSADEGQELPLDQHTSFRRCG